MTKKIEFTDRAVQQIEKITSENQLKKFFQEKNIESKSKNSPFINQDLSGRVKYTISNGQIATSS